MGFVVCKCGERISDTVQPNSNEGSYASSFLLDELPEEATAEDYELRSRPLWECPTCGSLIVDIGNGKVRHYRTDDGPAGLFARRPNS